MQSLQEQTARAERPIATGDRKIISSKAKFEVLGEDMIIREVKICGKSGRVYVPVGWIEKQVKIIRID
jgi:hypothetical protein